MIDDERPDAPEEGDAPEQDAPNEGAPGDVDPVEAQDAEPSAEPAEDADAPNEGATGDVEPAAEGEPEAEAEAAPEAEPEGAPEAEAEAPPPERARRERRQRDEGKKKEDEVVPGAHLEPDLVLAEDRPEGELDQYADRYGPPGEEAGGAVAEAEAPEEAEPAERPEPREAPAPRSALDLAADARYQATGKRKTSVARVILRPGDGAYMVNGRSLEDYFPRAALQKAARQPLQTAGFDKRMDVVAKIHGGGISAQAGALRHGVARALVEADPSLRVELKRRGFLSRDARAKERKKAGLKKARKRPQFSKR